MFGFSLPKLLVLLAIVLAVIGAFRAFERIKSGQRRRPENVSKDQKTNTDLDAETLIECPKCGVFHTIDSDCMQEEDFDENDAMRR